VNKTGTSLLAAGARQLRVPLYALCDSAKLLPEGRAPLPEAPKNPREVLPRRIAGVTVENFYFDRTPLDRLTGVITEDGILKPSELRRCLGRMRIHPALAGLED
jgi:translation initiation factor 2B subunit (eIF-2B alpha/beta/delta family)